MCIDDLQPIPWDSEDKGLATMLVPQTKDVNDILLFKFHQHGRRDVACKSSIGCRNNEFLTDTKINNVIKI